MNGRVALASVALALAASSAIRFFQSRCRTDRVWYSKAVSMSVACLLLLAFLPGSGLRTAYAHLRNWHAPQYDAGRFVARILADIPGESPVAVDPQYVLHAYLAGRSVVDATVIPFFFDVRSQPFEYAVFGPLGLEQCKPHISGLTLLKTYGDRRDIFGNYAELYRAGSR